MSTSASRLRAGAAKSDITTDAEGARIADRLYAKALVLDDGRTQVVIITMDAVAIGGIYDIRDEFLPKLRKRIEKELKIPGRNVLVNASHTHPPGRLLCDDAEQFERTFDAVSRALRSMTSVTVGAGVGRQDQLIMNRRLRLKNGQCWTIRHAYPCPPDEQIAGVGPIDPDIGILRIDRLDGRPFAVIYNFACHPYTGVPQGGITADFPGFASKVIEETLGGGAMAFFLQGAAGDITEILYKDVNRPRDSEPLGTMLGLNTLAALRDIKTKDATLSIHVETLELPRRADIPEGIRSLQEETAELMASLRYTSLNIKTFLSLYIKYSLNPGHPLDYSFRYLQSATTGNDEFSAIDSQNRRDIDKYLQNIHTMERLARIADDIATLRLHQFADNETGKTTLSAEVQGIRIGDFVFITCPAEALVEIGLNVKKFSPHKHTFMAAFSNGYLYYAPPAAEYSKGGYEVMECELAPEWQEMYENKVREVLRELT